MKNIWAKLLGKRDTENTITIVSGLPRSGTSMVMKMLEAGGMTALTDNLRRADLDNPKGYYEFEPVKKLYKGETAWLPEARGKVVKVIATLLPYLPDTYSYRIIFVHRDLREILASQKKMLIHRGEDPDKVADEEMAQIFEKHLSQVDQWIKEHPNVQCIEVNYNLLIRDPRLEIARINEFLGKTLDEKQMAHVIDPSLYRQRVA